MRIDGTENTNKNGGIQVDEELGLSATCSDDRSGLFLNDCGTLISKSPNT